MKRFIVFLLLTSLAPSFVLAADAVTTAEAVQIEQNYSFSPYLGSGFYGSSGDSRSIFVLNIPTSFDLITYDAYQEEDLIEVDTFAKEQEGKNWGLKFKTTFSAGFFDYDPEASIPELELPSNVGTLIVLPGLEFIFPVNPSWRLEPFVDLGLGRNFEADTTNVIYGVGVKSYYDFSLGRFPFLLGNRLYQTGYHNRTLDTANSFAALETGLNVSVLSGSLFGKATDLGLYYMNFIYSDDLNLTEISETASKANIQNEIGFTFGFVEPLDYKLLGRPRIGLGIRYTGEDRIFRLVFGFPFF